MPVALPPPPAPPADALSVRPATRAEFEALPEGTRAEFWGGHVVASPAPRLRHQDVVQNLYAALRAYAETAGGAAFVAPVDVRLGADTVVQPDVLYVGPDRLAILSERGVEGAPDLVAEVLSPATAYLDLSRKRRLYEAAGVREYWVLDPDDALAEVLALTDDGLRTAARVYGRGPVAPALLPGFAPDAEALFASPGRPAA